MVISAGLLCGLRWAAAVKALGAAIPHFTPPLNAHLARAYGPQFWYGL